MGREVTIVGGGLAGMVAAKSLLERGHSVRIIEASGRLGGKAGADLHGSDYDEHGWHLFPTWYLNIWAMVEDLGIRSSYVDRNRYAYMRAGSYPSTVFLDSPFSFKTAFHNLFHGVLPPAVSFLYQFALLDLMSQPVRRRAQLDQVTVNGFIRGKFYGIDGVAEGIEDTISRASAIESFEMSAMTVRNVMRFWFKYHDPWFRILTGNLQEKFIQPLENKIRSLGCSIEFDTTVTAVRCDDIGVSRLERMTSGGPDTTPVDILILAVPALDLKKLISAELVDKSIGIGGSFYLRSRIMAGMTIYMNCRLEGVPKDHLNFVDTPFALSMIDVTDVWGLEGNSVLCVVASDFTVLQNHSNDEAKEVLLTELQRYLPFLTQERIARVDLQSHVLQPLFANTAGAWPRRPKAASVVHNLFFAGDYCQTHVDLTCMEGAVSSGLLAAEAVRLKTGLGERVHVRTPKTRPRWLLVLLKFLLLPGALVALLVARLQTTKKQ